MRDFMMKLSDYLNERRNDPEKQENQLSVVMIGAIAVVIIILLLLLLWGYTMRERKQQEAETDAALEEATAIEEEEQLTAETFEEEAKEYMAENDGQELLRQEYLENINQLGDKVEELLQSLTQVEKTLSETIVQYKEGDQSVLERVKTLHTEVTSIVQNLKETQTKLSDLIDIVHVMDQKTLPMIQQQILEIRQDMGKAQTDITNLYTKIAALEQEDVKIWAGIGEVEKTLKTALDQNMTEVNDQLDMLLNQLNVVLNQLGTVENRLQGLSSKTLKYRYDVENNALYLEPYTE